MRPLVLLLCLSSLISLTSCTTSRGPASRLGAISFDWPVDKARLTQKFKASGKGKHWGLDLAARKGTPIFAAHKGRIVYAGQGFSGYGKLIIVEYQKTWASFYSHLDTFLVNQGQWVKRGQKIATMGRTGRATGNHLHFELRKNKKPLNPLAYLPR